MVSLGSDFFQRHHLEVARDLIGAELVWGKCSGLIVETEAYAVEGDAACHTASRPSSRNFVARNPAGTAYVYLNYGMYWLFNVLVKGGEADGIVLIRALEPVAGVDEMRKRRKRDKLVDLCSGPGKLSIAMGIDGTHHELRLAQVDFSSGKRRGFLKRTSSPPPSEVVQDRRIGISKATELKWRFLLSGNPHVSVKPSDHAEAVR